MRVENKFLAAIIVVITVGVLFFAFKAEAQYGFGYESDPWQPHTGYQDGVDQANEWGAQVQEQQRYQQEQSERNWNSLTEERRHQEILRELRR